MAKKTGGEEKEMNEEKQYVRCPHCGESFHVRFLTVVKEIISEKK